MSSSSPIQRKRPLLAFFPTAPRLRQAERERILRLQRHRVLQRRAAEDLHHVRGGHPRDGGSLQAARVHHAGLQVVYIVPLLAQPGTSDYVRLFYVDGSGQVINSGACVCAKAVGFLTRNETGVRSGLQRPAGGQIGGTARVIELRDEGSIPENSPPAFD